MALTYASFVTSLANLLVVPAADPNFQTVLPNIIDDAEQRIRRELDILNDIVVDQTGTLTPNNRNFTFPQNFVVSESINVFTPVGTTTNRNALVPISRETMDYVWGNNAAVTSPSVPIYYAMITDQTIIVGPPPDAGYMVEVIGTIIPPPLSSTNTETWISEYLPDLFLAAAQVFGAGYQLNFSSMADNPQQAVSWESHFQQLLKSASVEEFRKKYGSQAWSPKQPNSIATPPRA